MLKEARWLIVLITVSLIGVLALQIYLISISYNENTRNLQNDFNEAFIASVDTAKSRRIDRIQEYFIQDIKNPDLARIKLGHDNGVPTVLIISPNTGYGYVSIQLKNNGIKDSLNEETAYEEIINQNKEFLGEGSYFHWNDLIGERLVEYRDSIKVNLADVEEQLQNELKKRFIKSRYSVLRVAEHDGVLKVSDSALLSDTLNVDVNGFGKLLAVIDNPHFEVFRRSWFVFLISIIVILLVVISFYYLWKNLNNQKRLSQLKDDFIDNVTHELFTPISTLNLALDSLSQNYVLNDKEKTTRYLEVSKKELKRISDLVHNVLLTVTYDKGQLALNIERFDLKAILEEVVVYYKTTIDKHLEIVLKCTESIIVLADKQHFVNVMHNLIDNAAKYCTDSNPVISIEVNDSPESADLFVRDNGPGIPKADQEDIFNKFHRVSSNDVHDVKGLGIGLYYVKSILKQMGGDVILLKSSSKGSVFQLTIKKA